MTGLAVRIALSLLLVVACALPVGSARAADVRPQDNIATAVTEQDGSRVFEFAWNVSKQRAGVVDHVNAAYAAARCTNCRATAIAFQVVLVSGTPSALTPQNRAVAVTNECTACVVVAEARQFVRVVDQPVKFTDAGRAELADVRQDLRALELQDLPVDQLHEAVEMNESRVRNVLVTQVVPKAEPEADVEVLEKQLLQSTDVG
jgi:putative peptide zinc metalloprotease protein